MVLRKSFYVHWSAGRSPWVHEVNPGRDPSGLHIVFELYLETLFSYELYSHRACKTRENSNFFEKKGEMVISVKIRNFSRSWMTKRTSPLESSHEI